MKSWMLAALALACIAVSARAEEVTVDVPCLPLSEVKDLAKYRVLSRDEWMAARVVFFLSPDTPSAFPPGDKAMMRENDDGSQAIVFVDRDEACAPMTLMKGGVAMIEQVRKRVVTHAPGRM